MVASVDKKLSKSAFLTAFLGENPRATRTAVNQAWTAGGHSGTISPALVNKLRSELGLAGNTRDRAKAVESKDAVVEPGPNKRAKATTVGGKAGARGKGDRRGRSQAAPESVTTSRSQGKSGFIKEVLFDNPFANARAVNQAWKAAGMEGTISDTLVKNMRSKLRLTGNLRGRSRPAESKGRTEAFPVEQKAAETANRDINVRPQDMTPAAPASERKSRAGDRERVLTDVEGDLDRIIFKLIAVGGLEAVEEALRAARRVVVRSHKA